MPGPATDMRNVLNFLEARHPQVAEEVRRQVLGRPAAPLPASATASRSGSILRYPVMVLGVVGFAVLLVLILDRLVLDKSSLLLWSLCVCIALAGLGSALPRGTIKERGSGAALDVFLSAAGLLQLLAVYALDLFAD